MESYLSTLKGSPDNELKRPRPADGVPAGEEDQYCAEEYVSTPIKISKVYDTLRQGLDPSLRGHFRKFKKDPLGFWTALSERFDRDSEISKDQLIKDLHKERLKKGEKLDDYISRLIALFDRLETRGEVTSETNMRFYLLNGLPDDYEITVESIRSKADGASWEYAVSRLKDREETLNRRHEQSSSTSEEKEVAKAVVDTQGKQETAAFVQRGRGGRPFSRGPYNRDHRYHPFGGNNRGRGGHSHRGAHSSRGSSRESSRPRDSWIMCFKCYKRGHMAKECLGKAVCELCRMPGHIKKDCRFNRESSSRSSDQSVRRFDDLKQE